MRGEVDYSERGRGEKIKAEMVNGGRFCLYYLERCEGEKGRKGVVSEDI